MLRREFLAASAAGIFFPGLEPTSNTPIVFPDPIIRERVASKLGPMGFERVKLPKGRFARLPKCETKRIAWTVDDGASSASVREYLNFIEKHDLRMTFFITSAYPAWKRNRKQISELVAQGQLQLANHTFSHPSLTRISSSAIQQELRKCGRFIEDTFGVEAKPFFRPPYGRIDSRVIAAAKDIGYSSPVMWSGSLGDSTSQRRRFILQMGSKWIRDGVILLDHVNDRTPKYVFNQLAKFLRNRKLTTVTLDDVYLS